MNVRLSFLHCPKRKERAIQFAQIISIIKSKTPTLPPHLPKSYINQNSHKIQLDLHPLRSLLALFLKIFWHPFQFYYGQFVEAKNRRLLDG